MRTVRAASAGEIPVGRGKTLEVDGIRLAVFNAGDGRFYASSPSCPHEGGPLGEGLYDRGMIICPWHGFDFDPRTGTCRIDPELSISVYRVRVEGPDLLVEVP